MKNQISLKKDLFPIKINKSILLTKKSALKKIKEVDIITIYEPKYNIILGMNDFNEKKHFLKQAYFANMFNVIHYINEKSDKFSSFTSYLENGESLEEILCIIEDDIKKGFVPAKYGIFLAYNTSKIKKYKFSR